MEGGRFFDPETMRAQINGEIGVKAYGRHAFGQRLHAARGRDLGLRRGAQLLPRGDIAMTISWPPFGRWAAGYGTEEEALSWVPESTIADKVGYALPPGGTPQLAAGFSLSVASGSKN